MSAELDHSYGDASFFEVGERRLAWHREGRWLVAAPTFDEALKIGALDYEVVKEPTYRLLDAGLPTERFEENSTAFTTVRLDTGRELGMVGPDYQPVQNRDAFRVLVPLLDEKIALLETGGVLREGADAWMLVRLDLPKLGPEAQAVFEGEVCPYILVQNNHNGRRGVVVQETPIRVVCANTLGFAESRADLRLDRSITINHVGAAEARLMEQAMALFGDVTARYEVVAKQYRLLKAAYLDEALFRELVLNVAAPLPTASPRFNPEASRAPSVIARAEARRAEVSRLWTAGDGHTGDHSAWEAYNGTVQAIDHNVDLWPLRAGVWRTASLLGGRLRDTKQEVLNGLVGYAAESVN